MTQSIVVQVGQCGNQIGYRFWDLALKEHASYNKNGLYDDSMSSFFRNVDSRGTDSPRDIIPSKTGLNRIRDLKARAVLVDMEEGVVSQITQGALRDLFEQHALITDVSGCGNNWAVGNKLYGGMYRDRITETIRKAAERCDCLQCFFILHSMGGGTGSGVGTSVLSLLEDEYPEVHRFVTAVYPSSEDDVITSPYNSVLAMKELTNHADCVMPIENQALMDIVKKIEAAAPPSDKTGKRTYGHSSATSGLSRVQRGSALTEGGATGGKESAKPFDTMNNIVAHLLLNLTSSSRFEGTLNVDLNEISMNLVPFPRLHYLISSQTPLYALSDIKLPPRRLDQMFSDAFTTDNQLIKSAPKQSLYLACALMVRGAVQLSDIRRNIERLEKELKFIHWNKEGWKTGLCSVAPVGHPYSLLTLANNTCVRNSFQELNNRFVKLYRRKAHMHHYTQVEGMESSEFDQAAESLTSLIEEYANLEKQSTTPPVEIPRLQVA